MLSLLKSSGDKKVEPAIQPYILFPKRKEVKFVQPTNALLKIIPKRLSSGKYTLSNAVQLANALVKIPDVREGKLIDTRFVQPANALS